MIKFFSTEGSISQYSDIAYFPIKILLSFLVFTELLFWIGPVDYKIDNNLELAIYLIILNLALWYGYKAGVKKFRPSYYKFSNRAIEVLLIVGLIANIRFLMNSVSVYGGFSFNTLVNAIINPGKAYTDFQGSSGNGSFLDIIVLSTFRLIAIPLGIALWDHLNKSMKIIVILTILLQIIAYLCVGVRKGLFDIILYIFFIIVASKPSIITSPDNLKKLKRITILLVFCFLFYFVFSIASRYGKGLQNLQEIRLGEIRDIYKNLPGWLIVSLRSITSYLCQGYYALAKALEMGIKDVVMFSDNWVSAYYCEKFFGFNPIDSTYMADLEAIGIDRRVNWHTMYLWLANQYTFIGVPIVLYFVGYFFAESWNDAVSGTNDLSYIVFALFVIMVFYMFANNQVMSDSATSFIFWFIFYLFSRNSSESHNLQLN